MTYVPCVPCAVWVEATPCPGNPTTSRLFVHQDYLPPSTKTFIWPVVRGLCWSIDPGDELVCMPRDDDAVGIKTELTFIDDCGTCEDEAEPPEGCDCEFDGEGNCTGDDCGCVCCGGDGGEENCPGHVEGEPPPPCDQCGPPPITPPIPWPDPTTQLYYLTICAEHEDQAILMGIPEWDLTGKPTVWVSLPPGVEEGKVQRWRGLCWEVVLPPEENRCRGSQRHPIIVQNEDPDEPCYVEFLSPHAAPARINGGLQLFDDCAGCHQGVLQALCSADQSMPNADDAPAVWIDKDWLERTDITLPASFQIGVWCFAVTTEPYQTIPANAFIYHPIETGAGLTCEDCAFGVQFQPCTTGDGHTYWATDKDIVRLLAEYPDLEVIYQRIRGRCYSLDLMATPGRISTALTAVIIAPKCSFASCEDCRCTGEGEELCTTFRGVPVRLCPYQDATDWPGVWMHEDHLPIAYATFIHDGFCVYIDPFEPVRDAPADAEVLYEIDNFTDGCGNCASNPPPPPPCPRPPCDGPQPPPPPPPPPPICPDPPCDPPPPPPVDPPEPPGGGNQRYYQLLDCCHAEHTDRWVSGPKTTAIIGTDITGVKLGGECFSLARPGVTQDGLPAGVTPEGMGSQTTTSTSPCDALKLLYGCGCTPCSDCMGLEQHPAEVSGAVSPCTYVNGNYTFVGYNDGGDYCEWVWVNDDLVFVQVTYDKVTEEWSAAADSFLWYTFSASIRCGDDGYLHGSATLDEGGGPDPGGLNCGVVTLKVY